MLPHAKPNEIPMEIADQIRHKAEERDWIHEEDVRDLRRVDISQRRYRYVKRGLDVLISLAAIALIALPGLMIAAAIYIDDPGRVFFRQYRVGRDGKRFKMYKFRTMRRNVPKYMSTMELCNPDRYITHVGRFLRKTSIDELPQIFNILMGDMSVVGPRPLISDELEIHQMRNKFGVYQLRPGLTGLAQINGRDMVSPVEKVRWDTLYLEHFSLKLDMRIFLATIPKVFGGYGVVEGYGNQDLFGLDGEEEAPTYRRDARMK